jgi:hypothetical protein
MLVQRVLRRPRSHRGDPPPSPRWRGGGLVVWICHPRLVTCGGGPRHLIETRSACVRPNSRPKSRKVDGLGASVDFPAARNDGAKLRRCCRLEHEATSAVGVGEPPMCAIALITPTAFVRLRSRLLETAFRQCEGTRGRVFTRSDTPSWCTSELTVQGASVVVLMAPHSLKCRRGLMSNLCWKENSRTEGRLAHRRTLATGDSSIPSTLIL